MKDRYNRYIEKTRPSEELLEALEEGMARRIRRRPAPGWAMAAACVAVLAIAMLALYPHLPGRRDVVAPSAALSSPQAEPVAEIPSGMYYVEATEDSGKLDIYSCLLLSLENEMAVQLTLRDSAHKMIRVDVGDGALLSFPVLSDSLCRITVPVPALDQDIPLTLIFDERPAEALSVNLRLSFDSLYFLPVIPPDGVYIADARLDGNMTEVTLTVSGGRISASYEYGGENLVAQISSLDTLQEQEKEFGGSIIVSSHSLRDYDYICHEDGAYSLRMLSDSPLFQAEECLLTAREGVMTVRIVTRPGAYSMLYLGDPGDAGWTFQDAYICPAAEPDGLQSYTFEIPSLNRNLSVSALLAQDGLYTWLPITLCFDADTMVPMENE